MNTRLLALLRVTITAIAVVAAIIAARYLWDRYEVDPWTRDGRVRADVVQVTADVSGLVTDVLVHDNQVVHVGDRLFVIDQPRYRLALAQAEAAIQSQTAILDEARREDKRDRGLGNLVATEIREQTATRVAQAEAALAQATVARDIARLNLDRTVIVASVNGMVANMELRPGDYVSAGRPVFAVVDSDSLHVDGYFEETKLPRIHLGDSVTVQLMGERRLLRGHVDSIAGGIEDRERGASANLLPNVSPTFSWVRLAQRIPVRVTLDDPPPDIRLIAGRTATVTVLEKPVAPTGSSR
jgi:RND family efflux transporter MFP subunit